MILQPCDGEDDDDLETETGKEDEMPMLELYMNSIVGLSGNHTMKLKGKVKGEEVIILIDSGATHNFITTELIERLNIPIQASRVFEVSLGDGYKVRGRHICPTMVVEMQGVELQQSFHLFDMGDTDMVLGVEWLRSLGEVKMNWDELSMKFMIGKEERRIKGDPSLVMSLVSLKSMMRKLRRGGQGYLV